MNYDMEETNKNELNLIDVYEEIIGLKLPKDYKLFLNLTNGGKPKNRYFLYKNKINDGSLLSVLFGFTDNKYKSIMRYYRKYKNTVPYCTIPIGIDQGSNMILLTVSGPHYGKVYFADHETETEKFENLILIADSFDEFINGLKSEDELE